MTVVQKGTSRYKIKSGKVTGWIAQEALSFTLAETLDGATDAIEESAPPWIVRYQLFRIQSVDIDTQAGTVTAYAPHISYDLMGNITRVDYPYPSPPRWPWTAVRRIAPRTTSICKGAYWGTAILPTSLRPIRT